MACSLNTLTSMNTEKGYSAAMNIRRNPSRLQVHARAQMRKGQSSSAHSVMERLVKLLLLSCWHKCPRPPRRNTGRPDWVPRRPNSMRDLRMWVMSLMVMLRQFSEHYLRDSFTSPRMCICSERAMPPVLSSYKEGREALKGAVRFLVGMPRLVYEFQDQRPNSDILVLVHTDFGGCHVTRRSKSGGLALGGKH